MSLVLNDVAKFVTSKIEISEIDETNYISTENMLPNKGGITEASSLPDTQTVREYWANDILINNIRPYFKKIWFADKNGGCSNDVFVLRAKKNYDSKFLYYVLSSDDFFGYVMSTAKGTKMPRGDKKAIQNYNVPEFPIEDQIKISNLLNGIDQKIAINKEVNKNLDELCHLLFKYYFIDFIPFQNNEFTDTEIGKIPKGWNITTVGDILDCKLGGTPSRSNEKYWGGDIAWINSGKVNEFRILEASEYITELGLKKSATKLLPAKTTVIAITGATLGQISLLEIDSCANQSVIGVIPNNKYPYEFVYPLISSILFDLLKHQNVSNLKI